MPTGTVITGRCIRGEQFVVSRVTVQLTPIEQRGHMDVEDDVGGDCCGDDVAEEEEYGEVVGGVGKVTTFVANSCCRCCGVSVGSRLVLSREENLCWKFV